MITFTLIFYLTLAIAVAVNWIPVWVLATYALLGFFTFVVFGLDKHAAKHNKPRTAESKLWALAGIGGFAGAALAMTLLNHKTSKRSFLWPFWLLTALHLLSLAGLWWHLAVQGSVS
ncbi:DUF1294 domain-containing protein [Shewanella sp.]|uniref:DUF1294 domain-containing protein n=1 Tax=Shewanella sp. TaxID=50422 RepID=UPI003563A24E